MHSAKLQTMCSTARILQCDDIEKLTKQGFLVLLFLQTLHLVNRCVEMMGLIGSGNNPMVGMTVAVAVAIEEASKKYGRFLKKAPRKSLKNASLHFFVQRRVFLFFCPICNTFVTLGMIQYNTRGEIVRILRFFASS